ncbi:MAG: Glycosyl transferase [Candidatus Amesbacteria bacterium GW2011_GWA1_47_16]|uniref:Glycosyl transferase n=3 Tax=Candidatus Amesiibacteriota TaxID=1752730 RepID=A0A0G1UWI5_9BACT|nr:MAG: Glycosyl transferase [Candidatus Amesbacteria bacterium GW2011_GWA1_47_16]KKU98431.1 MAG: Glycosyl transferase [Candidatus Amesbacteria bacterium GW2011_GWB1_48_13]OGC98537.1 MAG: hypothetical protein A2701_01285 [Candidatus Amesbacteria bacterium RIFCSPHIGHO2_01_FULL_47_34]OGC99865.1 MAG: hypothetical protein A2972_02270 [Candidatus Amesbacteria bacterium RIFCSPLOWO2_01_FULL_47_33]
MPSRHSISIVIPTLNETQYIGRLIHSLQAQSLPPLEVIAVDLSTDTTPLLCREAGWKIIRQSSESIAGARAEGFTAARGEIIASTDADTSPCPEWLELIASAFRDPEVVCIYGPVYFYPESPFSHRLAGFFSRIFLQTTRLLHRDHILGMNFAVRASAYRRLGGFNPRLKTAEDVDLGYRISSLGRVLYLPRLLVYTSNRRLVGQGFYRFLSHHLKNYFRLIFLGRSSADFQPFR